MMYFFPRAHPRLCEKTRGKKTSSLLFFVCCGNLSNRKKSIFITVFYLFFLTIFCVFPLKLFCSSFDDMTRTASLGKFSFLFSLFLNSNQHPRHSSGHLSYTRQSESPVFIVWKRGGEN